ncbi:gamma-glutamyl-gamma-aminobutyrate hydrolase family protein [Candidatus Neptunochlamydia vexilliferae]|uniref:gamma-glutamyl-gamma-aminobutyrate hydrolase family protein n=1 Tax=Candidatus Neptunichlamydia vexilliferae TaxID=1651774 RepID=UPI00189143FA|nr:gamma-glutamyl-gamma-aminobutyrate hydrolase family protein [Candidatus Neptunochlamydia vexilliferae]
MSCTSLKHIRFSNCHFIDCDFRGATFSKGALENVSFSNCDFESAIFFDIHVDSATFKNCRLSYTCWSQATIHDLKIDGEKDPNRVFIQDHMGSLEGMTFLGTVISGDSLIQNCSLKNVIFCGNRESFSFENCAPHEINRPVIGIGMDLSSPAYYARMEVIAIKKLGGIPVYYMHYPTDIDRVDLREAASKTLIDYQPDCSSEAKSRGQWILENPRGEHIIERVKNYATEFFSIVDGLIIPGGKHVPNLLYKGFTIDRAYDTRKKELLRSIIEFTLLDLSEKNKKPVMGICRGAQIMNVFLNGTLANFPKKTDPSKSTRPPMTK